MRILVLGWRSRFGMYLRESEPVEPPDEVLIAGVDVTDYRDFYNIKGDWDVVINCAAFTDVNKCQVDAGKAYLVNARGAANAALFARTIGAFFVQISTDYVFSGTDGPYHVGDRPFPIQVYGHSKFVGEQAVQAIMGREPYWIVRLGWLYGIKYGSSAPMLAYTRRKAPGLWGKIKGTPTHAGEAAAVLLRMLHMKHELPERVIHLAPVMTPMTWHDFVSREVPHVSDPIEPPPVPARPENGGLIPSVPQAIHLSSSLYPLRAEIKKSGLVGTTLLYPNV